jgi:hypothetical protein
MEARLGIRGPRGGARVIYYDVLETKAAAAKTADQKVALALDAIRYTLQRVEKDPDFCYHMAHTETLSGLMCAYAALKGESLKTVLDRYLDKIDPSKSRHLKLREF